MKKISIMFFVSYMLMSGHVFAEEECDAGDDCYNTLKITMYNNSSHGCSLIDQSIRYGHLHARTRIPIFLTPGSISQFKMVESDSQYGTSITLAYQCDADHEITFTSHSNLRPTGDNPMKGTVDKTKNMRAIITDQSFNFWDGTSHMDWTFETI